MPFHHVDGLAEQIKRKCRCGGDPEMISDFVDDFVVRCKKCHISTMAFMKPEQAIEHWEQEDTVPPPLDLIIDDVDGSLAGEVRFMAVSKEDAVQYNAQSCDCPEIIITMRDRTFSAEHEEHGEDGAIGLDELYPITDTSHYHIVAPPSEGVFEFIKARFAEDGTVEGLKYRYGDGYVFIFASEYDLILTKSVVDLFEEDDTPIPDFDPSVLFE